MAPLRTKKQKINLLPGPTYIHEEIIKKFSRVPISHRETLFLDDLKETKRLLRYLTKCNNVEICLGTGTLANDIIAAQLSLINKNGLVVSNGEFGERLIDHAQRFNLSFKPIRTKWGTPLDYTAIERNVRRNNSHWIWVVHHETSTGMLNDLSRIQNIVKKYNLLFCVDCISSIGAVPVNLASVDFASGTSGKAISSYPGLSFVFYKKLYSSNKIIPRYLDLQLYKRKEGIPFTSSSNLVSALKTALGLILDDVERFDKIKSQTNWVRKKLLQSKLPVLVTGKYASPIISTIVLPKRVNSCSIGNKLKDRGFLVHYNNDYLKKRNWIQIASMYIYSYRDLMPMFNVFKSINVK